MKFKFFPIICLICCPGIIFSQLETSYQAETFGSFSTADNTPFWMLYHNWGMVPFEAGNFYVRGSVFHNQKLNKDFSFRAGVDLAGSSPHAYGTVWVQQLYGEINWKIWRLNIGSKEDYTSFLDPYLSSGDFDLSNNSRPIPEIKLSLPEFLLVPRTKGVLSIRGDFAVGKYFDGDYQKETALHHTESYTTGVLSHHKSIFFRFGNMEERKRLQFIIGLDHQAQWGGTLYQAKNGEYTIHKQPAGLDDFFRVVIAREGSANSSPGDAAYVAGSHVGAYTLRWDYKLKEDIRLGFYIHHFFDDGSGMAFENYRDNLIGLEYKRNTKEWLSAVVFEYIYTKNQTGPIHFNLDMDDEHDAIRNKGNGNDNYYNNGDYVQGRSNYGRTMGTPLFLSPEFNTDGVLGFKNNRIISFHIGVEGYLHETLQYRLLATTGKGWGRYYAPFRKVKEGFASEVNLIYNPEKIKDTQVKLSLGFNRGEFFGPDAFGAGITFTKRGILAKK